MCIQNSKDANSPFCSQCRSHIIQAQPLHNSMTLSKISIDHPYCRLAKTKRTEEKDNYGALCFLMIIWQSCRLKLTANYSSYQNCLCLPNEIFFYSTSFQAHYKYSRNTSNPTKFDVSIIEYLWYISSSGFLKFDQQVLPTMVIPDFYKLSSPLLTLPQEMPRRNTKSNSQKKQ